MTDITTYGLFIPTTIRINAEDNVPIEAPEEVDTDFDAYELALQILNTDKHWR